MTEESQEIVLRDARADLPDDPMEMSHLSARMAEWVGRTYASSGYFPDARGASQAITKILAGQEYGVAPMQAMTSFHIVRGKPGMHYSLIAGLIQKSGTHRYRVKEWTPDSCTLLWQEREIRMLQYGEWEDVGESSFSVEEAKQARVVKDDSAWNTYPKVMCFARALSIGARIYAAGVFFGPIYETFSGETDEVLSGTISEEPPVVVVPDDVVPATTAEEPQPTVQLASPSQRGQLWAYAGREGLNRDQFEDLMKTGYDIPSVDRLPSSKLVDARQKIHTFALTLAGVVETPGSEVVLEPDDVTLCSVEGCGFPAALEGLCFTHHATAHNLADPVPLPDDDGVPM